ncbi:uncharacterized protein LOC100843858 [Brachypodium distachyon]|uniref:Uncharacterized protein n=1 Tax=Brachypodium distachyon TaxID=15368 RepID=I1HBZ4_BRADI|nr:uncharacterized protein LOC100843858 [Brachypodium distachyon]KQK02689.1 hypothetical protein BRADI_2g03100v3 [Brachypodium distachyon]|eukprot:XP_014753494.1 uncharacterized protein LOC100843858 [Brachypodium distachyon]
MDDFSFKDANNLRSLLLREESLVEKKRRWLASLGSELDVFHRPKKPKFLQDVYLAESDVRADEVSTEGVRLHVEKSFGLLYNGYNHHVVQDGLELFKLKTQKDGSLCPESLEILHCTIEKLSNGALDSVAKLVTHGGTSCRKARPTLQKIVKDHLPKYLAKLDSENSKISLSEILTNPCSYRSSSINIATPVSPMLLSSMKQALSKLDGNSEQAVVAMNRKLREKECFPKFLIVDNVSTDRGCRARRRSVIVDRVWNRCRSMISQLYEGKNLPNRVAKALAVMNLDRKLTLRSMDISQTEFFPFPRRTVLLQNNILNALWSLPELHRDNLKLLRPILNQSSKVQLVSFRAALRRYLTECLFECDDGNLPVEAQRAISFIDRMSPKHQQVILTEERKEVEVEAVLDLSSCLRSLARGATEECLSDDEVRLEVGGCSKDNDFVLTDSNYFNIRSQQLMDEVYSNFMINTAGAGHYDGSEAACSTKDPKSIKDDPKMAGCADDHLSAACDDTAIVADKLIGKILNNMLVEDKGVDELTRNYLARGSISQNPQVVEAKNQKDIVLYAIQSVLPNLPESSLDKVRRIIDGADK